MGIEHKKPIVIHTREAEEDTLEIMHEIVPIDWPIHVHCFTSSLPFGQKLLGHWKNLYIGFTGSHVCVRTTHFTGVITFHSAKELHKTVQEIPLNKIVLETDAPFMAPIPHRGKICHSGYIPHIAEKISTLKNVPIETVYNITRENTKQLYGI